MTSTTNNSELFLEALDKIELFCKTGIQGAAQQAWERLRVLGMTEASLGRWEEWDEDFASRLYSYLASE